MEKNASNMADGEAADIATTDYDFVDQHEKTNDMETNGVKKSNDIGYDNPIASAEVDAERKDELKVVDANDDHKHTESSTRKTFVEQREKEEFDRIAKLLTPYSTFLVKYPSVIIVLTIVIFALSAVLAILQSVGGKGLPDFAEPTRGYEARGTDVAVRRIARSHFYKAYDDRVLSNNVPQGYRTRRSLPDVRYLRDIGSINEDFRIVYEKASGGNLFDDMVAVCRWYKVKIMSLPDYHNNIAEVHHIPNYIAILNGKTYCESITTSEVQQFVSLLTNCSGYYKNNSWNDCCTSSSNNCESYNRTYHNTIPSILYNVFRYLGDSELKNKPTTLKLTASVSSRRGDVTFSYDVYKKVLTDLDDTQYLGIKVAAFQMGSLKFHVFSKEMITQSSLLIIAIVFVILLGWVFSGSLFLGLMTFGCIIAAMIISWFVYNRVFDMPFFPFLNITILIFIIGIGADDVFVYTGEWAQAKEIYKLYDEALVTSYMIKWTTHTLRHSAVSMFVTSITTAAAFYANISSHVIAVKCFGLFSGTAIIVNYLLMITLFPCCVVIHEKYFSKCMHCCCPCFCERLPRIHSTAPTNNINNNEASGMRNVTLRCKQKMSAVSDSFFNKHLPRFLYFLRYVFLVVFFVLGVAGIVVAFAEPGLNPPSSSKFQMFDSRTSIEQYTLYFKEKFDAGLEVGGHSIDVGFAFGVELIDNGYKFDPEDKGSLVLKKGELVIDQTWLKEFCNNIKAASFYERSWSCEAIGRFFNKLESPCTGGSSHCCAKTLPLTTKSFMTCFHNFSSVYGSYRIYQPLYLNDVLKTFAIEVQTKYETSNYRGNERIVDELDKWTTLQMKNASDSFKGWWMVGRTLEFYDLQSSLFTGTKISLGIAIGVAFLVILITSLDLILSLFSVITILFIISLTVAILIGDSWKLNIVESTVFSVAAGLSADFTMHYSIAYKSSSLIGDRKRRTEDALSHIGSAMFMGAFTTFLSGLVMYPSTVLAYKQFGTFLMVVMFVSWLYSNFFFLPLCSVLGPTNNFGDLRCCRKDRSAITPDADIQLNNTS